MKPSSLTLIWCLLLGAGSAYAQVDEIKEASKSSSSKSENSGGSSSDSDSNGSFLLDLFGNILITPFVEWQKYKLVQNETHPSVVSFDLMAHVALQPSSYYIIHPRVRGNWGIFSTDYRMNMIVEESIDGTKQLVTHDWQILQLNIVANETVNLYGGGGFIFEAFGDKNTYPEWTGGLSLKPRRFPVGFNLEIRTSIPRNEFGMQIRRQLNDSISTRIYATAGAVKQTYYRKVDVWGIQLGLMLRLL